MSANTSALSAQSTSNTGNVLSFNVSRGVYGKLCLNLALVETCMLLAVVVR